MLTAINGNILTINGAQVEIDANTQISGTLELGAMLECEALVRPGNLSLALSIVVIASPEATPAPFEFSDYIKSIDGEWWTIGGNRVKVTGETVLFNSPAVGDFANVKALRLNDGNLEATRIEAIREETVLIDGVITAYSSTAITVDGYTLTIDAETSIIGSPEVGKTASCMALQFPDGRLIARIIAVNEPTATPAPTETPTSTPAPADTATVEPPVTPTATSEPTATPTP
jgi:hypothetical protein